MAAQPNTQIFTSLGEQLQIVAHAFRRPASADQRLLDISAAVSGAGSMPLEDGGHLIAPQFLGEFYDPMFDEGQVIARTTRLELPIGAQALLIPTGVGASRATGSRLGGVQVYRTAEGVDITNTKRRMNATRFEPQKISALVTVTDELLKNARALERVVTLAVAKELAFSLDFEVIQGTGGGQSLGLLSSGALVTVAKETNQAAATVVPQNVVKMWARLRPASRRNAVWLYNPDLDEQLPTMTLPTPTGVMPMYTPPKDEFSPSGFLFGRPLIPVEQASPVGSVGDLILADLSEYGLCSKPDALTVDVSSDVHFISEQTVFRFTYWCMGQPLGWASPVTPFTSGGATKSPFVTLAARA